MNFLSNRPRKLMATAALSVPLLAGGSTVLFSSAASASVTCDHGCPGSGGSPSASPSPTCTCMHTTPPPTTAPPTTPPPTTPSGGVRPVGGAGTGGGGSTKGGSDAPLAAGGAAAAVAAGGIGFLAYRRFRKAG